tara:strand:+ start:1061 stop:4525 length:3465 start_codon:yes stop_codon:yes gene_type:complete
MGLEKLKSAYSNIEPYLPTPEKVGKDVNPLTTTPEKQGKNINDLTNSSLIGKTSQFGIHTEPQSVDFFSNKFQGLLFQNSQGIMSKTPNITLAKGSREYSWPGGSNWILDQKGKGFDINLDHKSKTLFTGVKDAGEPHESWVNNLQIGGSLFGVDEPKKEFNFIWNNGKQIDYTLGNVTFPGPVDFQTITSMWTNQLTGLKFPNGFTNNMKDSELAKGFRTFSNDGTDFRNTNWYNIGNYTFSNIQGKNDINNFYIGVDSVTTPSQYPGIPNVYDGTWNNDGMATNYYDSNHTNNPIHNNFPGPVDFMSGMSLHPASLARSGSIEGFTNNYDPGMLGGWSVNNPSGDSKLLGLWNTNYGPDEVLTSMWTGYDENNIPVQFSDTLNFVNGADVLIDSTLPEITNVLGSQLSSYEEVGSIGVDFMNGLSQHELSLANSGSISGFDINYNPGLFGGWTSDNSHGDSKLLNLWNTTYGPDSLLTSMWTGYIDEDNNTVDFPGNKYNIPNFPGGYSVDNEIGDTEFPLNEVNQDVLTDMYSSYIDDESVTFNGTNLFESSDEISKGSNAGGELSPQFQHLYTQTPWSQGATENKYVGPVQDGSNISNLERFNIKSDLWNSGTRVGVPADNDVSIEQILSLGTFSSPIADQFGLLTEPYIIDHIGNIDDNDSNFFPLTRIQKDTVRISKFLSSPKGGEFIDNQGIMGTFQLYKDLYDPTSTIMNVASPKEGLGAPSIHYSRDNGAFGADFTSTHLNPTPSTYTGYLNSRTEGSIFDVTEGNANPGQLNIKLTPDNDLTETFAKKDSRHKPLAFKTLDWLEGGLNTAFNELLGIPAGTGKAVDEDGLTGNSGVNAIRNMQETMDPRSFNNQRPLGTLGKGDIHTLYPVKSFAGAFDASNPDPTLSMGETDPLMMIGAGTPQQGMPFYFRDLRDGSVLFFRAYIEGLTETYSPSWNSTNYIGRSEPVYTYQNSEREIGFTLKLFAQTKDELNAIYQKMERLSSFAYPQYTSTSTATVVNVETKPEDGDTPAESVDVKNFGSVGNMMRMKPPLLKIRIGDLFGSMSSNMGQTFNSETNEVEGGDPNFTGTESEMTGFVKTLSYSFPDDSPWEIQAGSTVPKYVEVELGFQVIHSEVPSLKMALTPSSGRRKSFYGINAEEITG